MPDPNDARLGHTLRNDTAMDRESFLRQVMEIACGTTPLLARRPNEPAIVEQAEAVLGEVPNPIYAYLGDLNPALGRPDLLAGLLIHSSWADDTRLRGCSRCDSGGLVAGKGGFREVPEESREDALRSLSAPAGEALGGWRERFRIEVDEFFLEGVNAYIRGEAPNVNVIPDSDPRRRCIEAAGADADRRLWTWEVRLGSHPELHEIEALVLTSTGEQLLHAWEAEGNEIPEHVRLVGTGNAVIPRHGVTPTWSSREILNRALIGDLP